MRVFTLFFMAISYLAISNCHSAWGHGVLLRNLEGTNNICVVQGEFTDGSPMSYAEVTIEHSDPRYVLQKGFSDRNGRFSFVPDAQGVWKVIFQDGMGHRCEINIQARACQKGINTSANSTLEKGDHELKVFKRNGLLLKALVGLFAIVGIWSLWVHIVQKKSREAGPKKG